MRCIFDGPLLPTRLVSTCITDLNHNGLIDSQDFFDFLVDFFGGHADVNGDGGTDSADVFVFLLRLMGGCG